MLEQSPIFCNFIIQTKIGLLINDIDNACESWTTHWEKFQLHCPSWDNLQIQFLFSAVRVTVGWSWNPADGLVEDTFCKFSVDFVWWFGLLFGLRLRLQNFSLQMESEHCAHWISAYISQRNVIRLYVRVVWVRDGSAMRMRCEKVRKCEFFFCSSAMRILIPFSHGIRISHFFRIFLTSFRNFYYILVY